MEQIETIVIGVFVGVLTALLLFMCKQFWMNVIVPFWQRMRYQGADISGVWIAEYKNDEQNSVIKLSLVIRQNAHSLTGSMQFSNTAGEITEHVDFELMGNYWENFLTLNAKSKDKKIFSGGTMYLKSVRNGFELDGYFSFRDANTDAVTSPQIKFQRT
ncbi:MULTISPECIES: hypothetical protein [Vibrio]|uniref:hypothetical protein n=1 Tax=Vibrio TaxID=662 RepID=UPI001E5DF299|nr:MULTISPECIES: hypothetical protein [Vibrio]MDV5047581.1 hypothetical protein [Vibrio diabolicus]UHJ63247.1 hypothetical protein LUM42_19805 [Vibrio furnissii]